MLYVSCSRITIFLFYLLYANNVEPLKILLFEQYLCGNELSSDSSKEAWQETANQLAKLHLKYWGADRNKIISCKIKIILITWHGFQFCHVDYSDVVYLILIDIYMKKYTIHY